MCTSKIVMLRLWLVKKLKTIIVSYFLEATMCNSKRENKCYGYAYRQYISSIINELRGVNGTEGRKQNLINIMQLKVI